MEIALAQNYNFEYYNVADGLPQAQVNAITQDSRGYLWLGTAGGGLSKFDGLYFTNYGEKKGLAGDIINSICEDKEGNIWSASSWGGITRFDGRRFLAFTKKDGLLSDNDNKVIFCDQSGKIWIGSEKGITTYANGSFKNYTKEQKNHLNSKVRIIFEDSKHNIWIGGDEGITFISKKDTFQITTENGLPSNSISAIYEDNNGDFLIGFKENGAIRLLNGSIDNKKEFQFKSIPSLPDYLNIVSIKKDKDHNIWIGSENNGIYVIKKDKLIIRYSDTNGFKSKYTKTLFIDKVGNIWIGTSGDGLVKYTNEAFVYYNNMEGLKSSLIFRICKDNENNIWTASYGDGLTKYDGKQITRYTTENGLPSNKVFSIIKDKTGTLWISTRKGLLKFSNNQFKTFNTSNGLPSNSLTALMVDKKNNLWIGTRTGEVYKYNHSTFTTYDLKDKLTGLFIQKLFEDSKGNVWVGTREGVCKIKDEKVIHFNTSEFCNLYIEDITEDIHGNIWFATARCIVKYDGLDFQTIDMDDGLSSKVTFFIHSDKKGNIWVGTNNGLDKITLNSYGQIKQIKNYHVEEGFKGIECNSRAIYEDNESNLWIGTVNGLIKYNPKKDKNNVFEPVLHLDNIKLYFEDVDWLKHNKNLTKWDNLPIDLSLDYDQNHLTFEFSAINLNFPKGVHYSFKLVPFDKDWYQITEKKSATYSNLPPGNYTFYVKARNNDGVWNQTPIAYSFSIKSPFWKTWWFYLIISIVTLYILYQLATYKERNQLRISKELEEKVKQRTLLIETQMAEKEVLLKEIHHRVKNNLQVINSLLSIQANYTDDKRALALFDEAKNRIRSMAMIHEKMYQTGDLARIDFQDYITDLIDDLIKTYSINCEISLNKKIEDIRFDIDTLIPIGLLINEVISNALKYAFRDKKEGEIIIHLSYNKKEKEYTLIVGDNGSGMDKEIFNSEEGSLGMELIKVFVDQIDGKITLQKTEGTVYEVKFHPRENNPSLSQHV
ncbi:MAG: hypothetical protein J5I47_06780 [Vicingus serpentipes]|nr:hypothetical protein [Vicingus serpentipes]